ncbi:type I pullulanase [Bacillus suaedaesalsae]|uniref:Type I pullulanase n=1 Tax=Bacillus suaedaesalsae TaxID=2810349 RepID=A0ABS2DFT2_9BACI|nr:type I pullulanase [Bacillus suaedaesalsae]MBM6616391.1 type I pullulanase [Bacillus suaedaesalsae]
MEAHREFEAYLDELTVITVLLPKHQIWDVNPKFTLLQPSGITSQLQIQSYEEHPDFYKYQCSSKEPIILGRIYYVITGDNRTDLLVGAVVRTPQFDEEYYYNGEDLGAIYFTHSTFFKVWAPTATKVNLYLFTPDGKKKTVHEMKRSEKGTWTITISSDLEMYLYVYDVCVNNVWRKAVDPYAKSVTINSEKGVVVDLQKTVIPQKRLEPMAQPTDAIIYETHIRDFTIHKDSKVKEKAKYTGFVEGTEDTCIDYVKQLGITHIELLPVNEFAGVDEEKPLASYNWGYNPLHYFSPEGSYSSNPRNPYARIIELQSMIQDIHEQDLRVIIDVVFNHVYIKEESAFEKIVPGYYFRYDDNGMPSNGTGVGNDLASERKMMRKFIIDCVLYWINVYNVDGLRFDLMGILDIKTMNDLRKKVDEVDSSILLFGEGWELNTPLSPEKKATIRNSAKMNRIGHFNDRFRDIIKGSTFNLYDRGFALGQCNRTKEVKHVMMGSINNDEVKGLFSHPAMSVNYVESHDNHTFWDKAIVCNSFEDKEIIRKRHRLATSMVLLSQGIPFLHSGQEFYRTKHGVGNSYQSPDAINELKWSQKSQFEKDVIYIKGLIDIRKSHGAFRFSMGNQVRKHMYFIQTIPELLAYELRGVKDYGEWETIIVVFNNSTQKQYLELDQKWSWNVLADNQEANVQTLYKLTTKKFVIQPLSCNVFTKE